ncbi:group 1 glycosyl transferase [Thermosipho africanus Ob7]|jgi:glycosyltransferase involved in cell wall biosynthesis|uniref:glycosyltransferase n=1 Tax=Thermosipho africanus TaxID=2421 RepID=UPI000E2B064C|nr:glycosyltransferase [Thermosipho africanus]RDI90814.1 group 1 glycosyl transferase [Thermosipho africanus Ob7]
MSKKKKRILLIPKPYVGNDYILNLKECLSEEFEIVNYNKKTDVLLKKYDYLYLNWIENLSIDSWFKYFVLRLFIFYVKKFKRKKIIWTFHNKLPHKVIENIGNKKVLKRAQVTMNFIIKNSDFIILHSKYAKNYLLKNYRTKAILIEAPHGSYIRNFDVNNLKKMMKNNILKVGFFGTVSKYKNVEFLIDTIKDIKNVEFHVFGSVDEEYKRNLLRKYGNYKNIYFHFKFYEKEEVPKVFSEIDVLALNYNDITFLHSGAAFLSFSMKTPVIANKVGMFNDFEDKSFVFLYNNKKQLIEIVENLKLKSKIELLKLGEEAFEYVSNNDWELFLNKFICFIS